MEQQQQTYQNLLEPNVSKSSRDSNMISAMTSIRVFIDINDLKKFYRKKNSTSKKSKKKQKSKKPFKKVYFFNLKLLKVNEDNAHKVYFYFDSINLLIENKELRKNLEEKDLILATVTHDLRSPIMTIDHTLKQVQLEVPSMTENLSSMIKGAIASSDMLQFLVGDILDAAKLVKKGTLTLNIEDTSIDEIFSDVFKIMEHKFKQSNVDFETFISEQVPEFLISDARRIKQIVLNFVSNSQKFTSEGKVVLMAKMVPGRPDIVEISVLDTGKGIKEEEQKKICDRFFTSGGKMNQNGVGLGLSICKTLANLLGPFDKIFFKSTYNKGSKFWVYLYLNLPDMQAEQEMESCDRVIDREGFVSIASSPIPPSFKDLPQTESQFMAEEHEFISEEFGINSARNIEPTYNQVTSTSLTILEEKSRIQESLFPLSLGGLPHEFFDHSAQKRRLLACVPLQRSLAQIRIPVCSGFHHHRHC